jgi:hypothetical protein
MNQISSVINHVSLAVNNGISALVQSATDVKVQRIACGILAILCIVSAVVLVVVSLAGRVAGALAVSAALLVIAYELIFGAHEMGLEVDDQSEASSVSTDDFEDVIESEAARCFKIPEELGDGVSIFGDKDFSEAQDSLKHSVIPYCFFREPNDKQVVVLLYRKSDETFGRNYDVVQKALKGLDLNSLNDDATLQTFKDTLHLMALEVVQSSDELESL